MVSVSLPEVDIDQYSTKLMVSVQEYALRKAEDHSKATRSSAVELSQISSNSNRNVGPSSDDLLSNMQIDEEQLKINTEVASPIKQQEEGATDIVY